MALRRKKSKKSSSGVVAGEWPRGTFPHKKPGKPRRRRGLTGSTK